MLKKTLGVITVLLAVALSGCGGGGGSDHVVPIAGNGAQADAVVTSNSDLFNLDGSDLLTMLQDDQGLTVTSSVARNAADTARPQSLPPLGTFKPQVTGGIATIDRPAGKPTVYTVDFLMTYRDASGLCECSNDNTSLPRPYPAKVINPNWNASPYATAASTTTLLFGYNAKLADNADHGGMYTFSANFDPSNAAQFNVHSPLRVLPIQTKPTVTNATGGIQVSWNPAAGTKEYFLAFLTHLNNDPKQPIHVVGFVVTDKTTAFVKSNNLYSGAPYQLELISADVPYINVYFSQGQLQLPPLPSQVDFSVAQITTFTAP
jgi:hypothetical protein